MAGELGDLGQLPLDVQLHPGAAGQPVGSPVVEAHGQPVPAQHRVLGDGGLLDGEGGVAAVVADLGQRAQDRKSTRLNSSHANISYAVFCLKKKKTSTLLTDAPTTSMLLLSA